MRINDEPDSPPKGLARKQLRPLLPLGKPVDTPDKTLSHKVPEPISSRLPSLGRCGIRQCRKIDCNLSSHRRYAAINRPVQHSRRQSASSTSLQSMQVQNSGGLLDQSVMRIEKQLSNGFPAMHFSQERTSTFRDLAHHYFARQIDRLIQLYSPHLDHRKYKQTMAEYASSNDVFCVCIMANAKTDMIMQGHIHKPDPASELVYATTAHVLRQQLNNFKHTDIDWLLVLVIALVGFDLAFDRKTSLRGHHAALKHLIEMKGGLHTIGHIVPYVLNTDRFLAVFTGQYPAFTQSPMIPVASKGDNLPGPYGEAFEIDAAFRFFDPKVVEFCLEQCKLIYLMESSQISLEPYTASAADASVLGYFLYQRDQLHCKGTYLHAYYHENRSLGGQSDPERSETASNSSCEDEITLSKSRCVLLATLILEYVVAHGNYYTVKGPYLAAQIQSILERQSATEWTEHVDMLLWILFVLATAVPVWDGHDWVLNLLRHWLKCKTQGHWPYPGWQDVQLRNLKRFVWAETKLQTMFAKVCRVLVNDFDAQ